MPDDLVNVKPEDLERLARAIERYQQDLKDTIKKLEGEVNRAHWHDPQKDKFVVQFQDMARRSSNFAVQECRTMTSYLRKLRSHLENIKAMGR